MEHRRMILKWMLPAATLLLAIIFYCFVSGCGFLGIVFGVISVIATLFCLLNMWHKRKPVAAKRLRSALLGVLSLVLIASVITLIPILRGPATAESENGYLIVLGAGVQGNKPSEILEDRIHRAYQYLLENPTAICIATGGKGNDENISEAQCIYNYLTAMGIDGSRIWLEDQATSTIENFRYSIALIEEKTGKMPQRVTVLSNEFHLYRASIMAEDCGLEADFVAAPTSKPMIRISYTIREIFALWKYLTIGG